MRSGKTAEVARTRQVLVRLTEEEHDELTKAARRLAMTNPDLLRLCWFACKDTDDNARREMSDA